VVVDVTVGVAGAHLASLPGAARCEVLPRAVPGLVRVAVVWRGARGTEPSETRNFPRLEPVFVALANVGVQVEPILYCDEDCLLVRDRLVRCDGVLVWVDPISDAGRRNVLDALQREVAEAGVWVSAHPDVIEAMGTKDVLFHTRTLSWGTDTDLYRSWDEFRARFPARLHAGRPRVLKQNRGNGGLGVWKVTPLAPADAPPTRATVMVRVQHAAPRDESSEVLSLDAFERRCEPYFVGDGTLVDQPFIAGVVHGMVRAYQVQGAVVGYARQQPDPVASRAADAADRILGMPSPKAMFRADEPAFSSLRRRLETEWIPHLCDLVGLEVSELPLLWDADFLTGPPADTVEPSYLLCEINVSSVLPFPPDAPAALADAVNRRRR
jgi:hypothetical protein